jgi:antitoxin component YwqK of YwqJK toxin-antitoxin module
MGFIDGIVCKYYPSEKIQLEVMYQNNEKNGKYKTYYENGKLKEEGVYKNDKLEGIVKFYYESGKVEQEENYKNGKPEGMMKVYYESGKLKAEGYFANGKQDGLQRDYYESGKLLRERHFKNGIQNGIVKSYYENGNLQSEGNFKNDKSENHKGHPQPDSSANDDLAKGVIKIILIFLFVLSIIISRFRKKRIKQWEPKDNNLTIQQQILKLKMLAGDFPWDSQDGREIRAEIERLEILGKSKNTMP